MSSVHQRILKCMSELFRTFQALCEAISKGTRSLNGDLVKTSTTMMQIKVEINICSEILIAKDKELKLLLRELVENQKFQQKIKKTQQILQEKEFKITKLTESLEITHSKLTTSLHQSSPIVKSIKQSKNINLQDVLSYAHFISRTTSDLPSLPKELGLQGPPFPAPEREWLLCLLHPNRLRLYKNNLIELANAEKEQKQQKLPKIDFDRFHFERDAALPPVPQKKISLFDEDSDDSSSSDD